MLEEIKPDAVCLMAPVWKTCEMATQIMKLGFNVIMEKPPGRNTEEINKLITQANISKVNVRCAFNRRYAPLLIELKKRLKEENEEIYNITYQLYRKDRYDEDFATTAIHAVDTTKYIIDSDYKRVNFSYQQMPEKGKNVKNIYMDCEFENGTKGHIDMVVLGGAAFERISVNTFNHTYYLSIPIIGCMDPIGELACYTKGRLSYFISGASLVDSNEPFEGSGFFNENRFFFEHIRNNRDAYCDLETAIQSVEIEDYIRNSKEVYEKRKY